MKAHILLTDDNGNSYEGVVELKTKIKNDGSEDDAAKIESLSAEVSDLDYSLNMRAFMKKYVAQKSGPKKFVLLVAKLLEGKVGIELSQDKIKTAWNSMKTIMGGPYYSINFTRAKDNGWVDSPKRGACVLASRWREVLVNNDN